MGDITNITTWTKTSLKNITQITAGYGHSLALDNKGIVWVVGNNAQGQLGLAYKNLSLGDKTNINKWTKTSLKNIKQITSGYNHSLVLDNNGIVWAVGNNAQGQLGLSDITDITSWTKTTLANIKQITAGYGHSLALDGNGDLWAVGYNKEGQLGLGDTTNRNKWTKVVFASNK